MSFHPEPCPVALPAKVDSPVEAGKVADEVRQKGAPPPGVSRHIPVIAKPYHFEILWQRMKE